MGFARNPSRRRRHSRRRFRGLMSGTLMPAAIGAGGAVVSDVALAFLPLPAMLQGPIARPLVRGALGVALGVVVGMATSKSTGAKVTAGALTVVAYDALRGFLQRQMPAIPLGEVSEYPALAFNDETMGEVIDVASSAPQLGDYGYSSGGGDFGEVLYQ